jgi:putative ABC transport system substrate-binding protein
VPGLARVASLVDPNNASNVAGWEELHTAAELAGLQAERIDLASVAHLDGAFQTSAIRQAQAVSNDASGFLLPVRAQLADLALRSHLPAIDINRQYAEAGLLMAYGPKGGPLTQSHRGAAYVDKILKGAKPSDLPVDQPTEFDLVINARTAQSLGVSVPPEVLAQVTDWV